MFLKKFKSHKENCCTCLLEQQGTQSATLMEKYICNFHRMSLALLYKQHVIKIKNKVMKQFFFINCISSMSIYMRRCDINREKTRNCILISFVI